MHPPGKNTSEAHIFRESERTTDNSAPQLVSPASFLDGTAESLMFIMIKPSHQKKINYIPSILFKKAEECEIHFRKISIKND